MLGRRYQLDERIGTGGYGEVWRATDTVLSLPVAVKVLLSAHAQHAESLARFRAEAHHAGRLAHENIARVYDYGEPGAEDPPYLVMELVDGPSLAQELAGGALDAARCLDIVAQAAAGLQAAHAAGLVHRDIKPANLLLGPGGVVKITDFGISHAIGSAPVTTTGMLIGTPGYLAPERAAGAGATPASDLYALGVVGYECLAGSAPFTGAALEVALAHRDRPLPPLPASVPAGAAALIMQLTAKDLAQRPPSAGEAARQARQARQLAERIDAGPGTVSRPDSPAQAQPGCADDQPTQDIALAPAPRRQGISGSGRRPGHRALLAGAAAVAAVTALVLANMNGPVSARHPAPVPSAAAHGPKSAAVLTVDINAGDWSGSPSRSRSAGSAGTACAPACAGRPAVSSSPAGSCRSAPPASTGPAASSPSPGRCSLPPATPGPARPASHRARATWGRTTSPGPRTAASPAPVTAPNPNTRTSPSPVIRTGPNRPLVPAPGTLPELSLRLC